MMMFVSPRNLPLGGVNPFAFLFDCLDHLAGWNGVERGGESAQICAALAHRLGCTKRSGEPEHLLLQVRRQLFEPANRVVTVCERAMTTTVNDIEHIESSSYNGIFVIRLYFQPNAKVEMAIAQVTSIDP